MLFIGVLLVAGSGLTLIGSGLLPFDKWFGVTGSIAGVAFGAGIIIAGFDPEANVSWVRAIIFYCVLELIYEIVNQITTSRFDIVGFLIAIIVGGMLLWLYPNKSLLWMTGSNTMAHKA
jgi:uncharacterized membrane protein (UPF0136 family)